MWFFHWYGFGMVPGLNLWIYFSQKWLFYRWLILRMSSASQTSNTRIFPSLISIWRNSTLWKKSWKVSVLGEIYMVGKMACERPKSIDAASFVSCKSHNSFTSYQPPSSVLLHGQRSLCLCMCKTCQGFQGHIISHHHWWGASGKSQKYLLHYAAKNNFCTSKGGVILDLGRVAHTCWSGGIHAGRGSSHTGLHNTWACHRPYA